MIITDAQIHLWEADNARRPWPKGVKPNLVEPMTAERALSMMDELGIDRAVIAPPAVCGFDPSYAIECAQKYPNRFAVTSRWDFDDPTLSGRMEKWLDTPGMIGIRIALLPSQIDALNDNGRLTEFWDNAEQFNIPVMAFAPGTINEIGKAANSHPKLRLIIDHANLVGSTTQTVPTKIAEVLALAHYPNVGVKLGALPQRSAFDYPYQDLHPYLNDVLEAYGADRLMWASDVTTSMETGRATYRENLDMIRMAFANASQGELEHILGGSVSNWLNWPVKA